MSHEIPKNVVDIRSKQPMTSTLVERINVFYREGTPAKKLLSLGKEVEAIVTQEDPQVANLVLDWFEDPVLGEKLRRSLTLSRFPFDGSEK